MMDRFGLLLSLALRNLTSHRIKTVVIASVVAIGTFVMVVGLTLLANLQEGMQASITSSITGDIQVWSDASEDSLSLINLGGEEPDIGELPDFGGFADSLMLVDGVRAVVPMGNGSAFSSQPTDVDLAIENLRRAVTDGRQAEVDPLKQQLRHLATSLEETFVNQQKTSSSEQFWDERIAVVREVASDAFWARFDAQPAVELEFMDTQLAPLSPTRSPILYEYLATDLQQFQANFDRFRLVDGEMTPPGKRGLMLSKRGMERGLKHSVAREIDALQARLKSGASIADGDLLKERVSSLQRLVSKIVLQLGPKDAGELRPKLQEIIGSKESNLTELVASFLRFDDGNFSARYQFFYDEIAPRIRLYAVSPGETVALTAFTKTGVMRSVNVRVWGTFEFEGLETSSLAGSKDLLDLVSFRQLYGKMTDEQRAELATIRTEVGVESFEQDAVEDALFGSEAEIVAESPTTTTADAYVVPAKLEREESEGDDYDPAEARRGLALSAAVVLDEKADPEEVLRAIAKIDGLQATDWQSAAGIVGKFIHVMTAVLWIAILLLFLVAAVILNNSMLMATMERIPEIGTLRAIGGRRSAVLALVMTETLLTTIAGAVLGSAVAAIVIAWLGKAGIPAPTSIVAMLFGGDTLYPSLTGQSLLVSFVVVVIVSLLSALIPARVATRVPPVVAMQGD